MSDVTSTAVCVDFGSTWTKALHVDLGSGEVLGTASSPTTLHEVMEAYDACVASLVDQDPRAAEAEVLACSSAGGGLRIAVVGNEELVTAEAGRRVALSSGGKVVGVISMASRRGESDLAATLTRTSPDLVLLTGGTDGGNTAGLLGGARALVAAGWTGPVVVAGNVDAGAEAAAILAGLPCVLADNVVPRIGVLAPAGARSAVRELFLTHVIGGKELSARPEFLAMVQGATPDVVLTGAELLAEQVGDAESGLGTGLAVVDVGGATTDVHSVVRPDPEQAGLGKEVVGVAPVTRTVEGDLGLRWSAVTTVEAAATAQLPVADGLLEAARRRHDDPAVTPRDETEAAEDEQLAAYAAGLALRRHAGRHRREPGVDLREVGLVVASGGVFRHGAPGVEHRVFAGLPGDARSGWLVPERPRVVTDRAYVLAAMGLLAAKHPRAARRLARDVTGA